MSAIFNKILAFFMSILALLGITSGVKHFTPDVKGDGWAYAVVDNEVEFSFPANASTGCSWEYDIDGDSIRFENRDYVDKKIKLSDKPLVGSGGTEYIKFKAVKEGKATVTFEYGQHWDGGSVFEKYAFIVTVDGSGISTVEISE
ncbi:MAG: protease inhibitor I42 family protein [Acutalibacteraceae bacterium]|nr:protease inhibitor I42 family protein [Oscillospiraceae bacterium]